MRIGNSLHSGAVIICTVDTFIDIDPRNTSDIDLRNVLVDIDKKNFL